MNKWINAMHTGIEPGNWATYVPGNDYWGDIEIIKIKPVDDLPGTLPERARRYVIRVLVQGRWYKMSTTLSDPEVVQGVIRDTLLSVVESEVARKLA